MNKHLIAAILIAASAAATGSAFATSSSTAPQFDPTASAPASQHGPNIQMIASDQGYTNHSMQTFGGTADTPSQSGTRLAAPSRFGSLYSHH